MKKKMFLALALVFGISYGVLAQGQDPPIRFLPGPDVKQDGELQVAVIEYTRASTAPNTSDTKVILYGVVHVADQSYYDLVQRDLDSYDEVLYEGVKQGSDPNVGTKGLNAVQKLMGVVLGLTFQKDGIDYKRDHFVHADVDMDRLKKQMKGQSIDPLERYVSPEMMRQLEPFLDLATEFIKMYMQSNPGMQDSLKVQFGQQLANTDISAQLSPEQKRAILDDRNQLVEEVLVKQIRENPKHKSFAIFYGAAHNPDFELRLQRLGFTKASKRWMSAWTMGRGAQRTAPEKERRVH
jgi:hypothetical protein